jgi:hypothetical protein
LCVERNKSIGHKNIFKKYTLGNYKNNVCTSLREKETSTMYGPKAPKNVCKMKAVPSFLKHLGQGIVDDFEWTTPFFG